MTPLAAILFPGLRGLTSGFPLAAWMKFRLER